MTLVSFKFGLMRRIWENLKFYQFSVFAFFDVIFNRLSSFLQKSGLTILIVLLNYFQNCFGRKFQDLVDSYFRLRLENNVLSFRKMSLRNYILLML